jgi:hypothetical protein
MSRVVCDSGYDANWCDETLSSRRLIEPKAYAGSLLVGMGELSFLWAELHKMIGFCALKVSLVMVKLVVWTTSAVPLIQSTV